MILKYKIYRNLNKDCFSILKWNSLKKGYRLQSYEKNIVATDVEFKVSQAGRQRVLKNKQKNVHAYVCCNEFIVFNPGEISVTPESEIYYDPYKVDSFVIKNSGTSIEKTQAVALTNNKCYLIKYECLDTKN